MVLWVLMPMRLTREQLCELYVAFIKYEMELVIRDNRYVRIEYYYLSNHSNHRYEEITQIGAMDYDWLLKRYGKFRRVNEIGCRDA
jgi:hypothetical protein